MSNQSSSERTGRGSIRGDIMLAAILDLVLLTLFAIFGRASHQLELNIMGVLETMWPFLIGLWVGWAPTWTRRSPTALWPTGVWVWAATVIVGLLFRWLSNGLSLAPAFALVATGMLAAFLFGWRLIATIIRIILNRRSTATEE